MAPDPRVEEDVQGAALESSLGLYRCYWLDASLSRRYNRRAMLKVTLFLLSLVTALWGLKLNFLALKHPPGAQEVPTPLMVMAALSMLLADWRVCGSPFPKLALGDYYDAISTRKRPLLYLLWCYCLIMVVRGIFNSDGPLLGSTLVLGMAGTANLISLSDS